MSLTFSLFFWKIGIASISLCHYEDQMRKLAESTYLQCLALNKWDMYFVGFFFFWSSPEDMLIDFREHGVGGEHQCKREKHGLVASHIGPDPGLNSQLRHVPWLGIEPAILWSTGPCSNQLSPTSQGRLLTFSRKEQLPNLFVFPWSLCFLICKTEILILPVS